MQLIKDASAEKLRGAYYTPPAIASFILHWGINGGKDADILEPSCGDGVFLESMRDETYQFMLTTTILERGVTFRDIDVLVIGAEDRTFTEAALIQIAGRAGRHKDFPTGEVLFLHYGQTKALKSAIRQIKKMNRLARERGLLINQ